MRERATEYPPGTLLKLCEYYWFSLSSGRQKNKLEAVHWKKLKITNVIVYPKYPPSQV